MTENPTFNLWHEPWIDIEQQDGAIGRMSIAELLRSAHTIRGLYEPSPLVIVGIHRLLLAILQDIIAPEIEEDLAAVWDAGRFSAELIDTFGHTYAHRFDLFDNEVPFLQSADIPQTPVKWGKGKSVGYLLQEQTAGTAVTHYKHLYDRDQALCPHCAAKGLLLIPAFASSGGAGIKPSINGVPPIYVLPSGETYFISLAASLTTPHFQPEIADQHADNVWWRRPAPTVVPRATEVHSVGYLHSLTFPARRVRLHPRRMHRLCSRCGSDARWFVPEMTYAMGESRPKNAAFWQDPFAAYRQKSGSPAPIPIRPIAGRAVWREYSALFLPQKQPAQGDKQKILLIRPSVIEQIEALRDPELEAQLPYADYVPIPFQTIGLRTDMKMKIFEWQQSGFSLPPRLLSNVAAAQQVEQAINFAIACDGVLKRVFRKHYGGNDGKGERNKQNERRLSQAYWQALAPQFNTYTLAAGGEYPDEALRIWLDSVKRTAQRRFDAHVGMLGTNAEALRQQVQSSHHCAAELKRQYDKQGVTE